MFEPKLLFIATFESFEKPNASLGLLEPTVPGLDPYPFVTPVLSSKLFKEETLS